MLNALIVDDEPMAHEVLVHHCRAHPDIRIVGQCTNAAEALTAIESLPVDLLFLDIQMPRFGGLDLLRGLNPAPLTIIVSAHREHALDGYDLDVVDYLLKPVSSTRLAEALEKARRRRSAAPSQADADLVLKVDRALRRFHLDSIGCFEAQGNFAKVWFDGGSCFATITLRKLQELLPSDRFRRVHKSYIVNIDAVTEVRSGAIILRNGMTIPIGKRHRDEAEHILRR